MRGSAVRRLTVCLVLCCVAGLAVSPVIAFGEGSSSEGSSSAKGSGASSSSIASPLVVPGVQALDEDQQALDAQQARRASPEAFVARERSRTEFEHLGTARVALLAREAFPDVVDHPAGGPPPLSSGERIVRYVTPNAAQLALPNGRHAVVESLGAMAKETSKGHLSPIDLGLDDAGGDYVPASSDVAVRIPKRLSSGVQLAATGVSLTPASTHGASLGGSTGRLDGSTVLYANTQRDTDTLVKPTTGGFEIDAVLRSEASPGTLYFRVGMPTGARLFQKPGSSVAQVVKDGRTIASILTPRAQDAAGTPVSISVKVAGSLLTVTVADTSAEYQYPIEVDPDVFDEQLTNVGKPTNWRFETDPTAGSKFTSSGWTGDAGLTVNATGRYAKEEAGMLIYPIREGSEARLTNFTVETSATLTGTNGALTLQTESSSKKVEQEYIFTSNLSHDYEGADGASPGNAGRYALRATEAGEGASAVIESASVTLEQEKKPELALDTTHEYVDGGKRNILYGSGSWLGPNCGCAFEYHAKDPGVGISHFGVLTGGRGEGGSWEEIFPILTDGECEGVQCNPEFNKGFAYGSKMPEGEDYPEAIACDDTSAECADVYQQAIKVDAKPPSSIKLTGLPSNDELGDDVKYTLKAEATGSLAGVKSIELLMDGRELGKPSGSCTTKACTAKAEWMVGFEGYGAGPHTLTALATDNAGNVGQENYTVTVRHASPVALGPGSVSPVTGEFSLASSDVLVGAPPAALTVSRHYGSRHLTAGASGPFGPQWSTSLGGEESLTTTSSGNVELIGSGGLPASFTRNSKGELESPKGDGNLALEGKEAEKGKGITEYWLKNAAQGATTKFVQPSRWGLETIAPTIPVRLGRKGRARDSSKVQAALRWMRMGICGCWIMATIGSMSSTKKANISKPSVRKAPVTVSFMNQTGSR
jgi:hypothetical protein